METNFQKLKLVVEKHVHGIVLCVALAFVAKWLGSKVPILGSGTSAILLGIFCANGFGVSERSRKGVKFCESKVLELAVGCMGFNLSLTLLSGLGYKVLFGIVIAVLSALSVAYVLSRLCPGAKTLILLTLKKIEVFILLNLDIQKIKMV